jgi:hypothetical protein
MAAHAGSTEPYWTGADQRLNFTNSASISSDKPATSTRG